MKRAWISRIAMLKEMSPKQSLARDIVADVERFWSKAGRQFQRQGNLLK